MRGCRRLPPPRRPRGQGLRVTLTLPPPLYRELKAVAEERREALATTARVILGWYLADDSGCHDWPDEDEDDEEGSSRQAP